MPKFFPVLLWNWLPGIWGAASAPWLAVTWAHVGQPLSLWLLCLYSVFARIPFWFCGPVVFFVSVSSLFPHLWMVLWWPIKQSGRGSIPSPCSLSSYKLANLLSAEMNSSWQLVCLLFTLLRAGLLWLHCFFVWQLRPIRLWRIDLSGVSSWSFQEWVKQFRCLPFENLRDLQVLWICWRVLLSLLWWFFFREVN